MVLSNPDYEIAGNLEVQFKVIITGCLFVDDLGAVLIQGAGSITEKKN